jgi:micrococcal nuclease
VQPQFTYRASVIRVIDGDGLELAVDVGFRVFVKAPFRLLGVNAPEKYTPTGKLAKAWTEGWCAAHPDLVVTTEKDPEKYGRWLGTVVGSSDGEVLNVALVAAGHALVWDGKGRRPI